MTDFEPGEPVDYHIDPATEREYERAINGDGWTVTYSGKLEYSDDIRSKPRVGRIETESGLRPMAVSYSVDRMSVAGERSLDIMRLLPSQEWRLVSVSSASTRNMPPEVLRFFHHFQELDVDKKEIYIGKFDQGSGLPNERWVKLLLWNVLTARAVEEMGAPGNTEAVADQRKALEQRRKEVLESLMGKSDQDPYQVAIKPFSQK